LRFNNQSFNHLFNDMKKVLFFVSLAASVTSCNLFTPSEELLAERARRHALRQANREQRAAAPSEQVRRHNEESVGISTTTYMGKTTTTTVYRVQGERVLYKLDSLVQDAITGETVLHYQYERSENIPASAREIK
jgi:hypothetical protein